jgi:hypothetical protein
MATRTEKEEKTFYKQIYNIVSLIPTQILKLKENVSWVIIYKMTQIITNC